MTPEDFWTRVNVCGADGMRDNDRRRYLARLNKEPA